MVPIMHEPNGISCISLFDFFPERTQAGFCCTELEQHLLSAVSCPVSLGHKLEAARVLILMPPKRFKKGLDRSKSMGLARATAQNAFIFLDLPATMQKCLVRQKLRIVRWKISGMAGPGLDKVIQRQFLRFRFFGRHHLGGSGSTTGSSERGM